MTGVAASGGGMIRLHVGDTMVDMRRSLENALRQRVSEHVGLEVHDRVYMPVRRALDPITMAVDEAVREALGAPPRPDNVRAALGGLRALLDGNAKERELQRALLESGLLSPGGICRAVSEVSMGPITGDSRGMRMDLVVDATKDDPAQIIELKRGSHRLLVRRGSSMEGISRPLENALRQVQSYGGRVSANAETRLSLEEDYELALERIELRLIAGRRLPDAFSYHLLSDAGFGDGPEVWISTWDGFLAELERIAVG
jgi:hypothetical protein